ncbi:MAG: fasciclin domain-containing protein [Prevotella sp.]|nr:fasciclin domain-containing protein [Prevotella sp.]
MITRNLKYFFVGCLLTCMGASAITACVDNDDDVPENYYSSTKLTAAAFLEERPELFSEFIGILKRTPYFSMLSTYGTYSSAGLLKYTVFAPTNEGVERYLQRHGYSSINDIPIESCDTLARTHIIKKGAFFTTDISEGALPELNMDDAYIVLSSDSDVTNNNKLIYYINKNARVVERDDSVTNGVVHVLNNTISSSSMLLADKIEADSSLMLFSQALQLTGMADSLTRYLDETYSCGEDSVHTGTMERCTSGGAKYTRTFWVGKRYFKYTAFVEPDSVYHRNGIYTIDDLKAYAKRIYDETYPQDAGLYDDDPKHRKNPLNRFVSYHLLNRVGQYNSWVVSGAVRECLDTKLIDPEEYYETMCPGTIMRFAGPSEGLFINRRGVQNRAERGVFIKGVKVLSPSESGETDQNAINGVYHYLDDILAYTTTVRDVVLNRRIRIDATVLSPDFMNCNGRGRYGEDILTGFKNQYITDWTCSPETFVGVHSDVTYWWSYQANAVCVSGVFDVSIKLPPVPTGTYEVRLGYTPGDERGVIQAYLNNEPCGIPIDLRVYAGDQTIGAIDDTEDEEENMANDKAMHNRGYMKAPDSWHPGAGDETMRSNGILRRILTTRYLDSEKEYRLRVRQVLDDPDRFWSFDYIELCPKSVYGSPEGEDTH